MIDLIHGDCRVELRELALARGQFVQSVFTSPPYYGGLRSYQDTPDLVWGGRDNCDHVWGEPERAPWANDVHGPNGRNKNVEAAWTKSKEAGAFCGCCGAWRGQLGHELLPNCERAHAADRCGVCYVCHLVEVFRLVRRVLRPDGTVWLNLGDTFAAERGYQVPSSKAGDVGNSVGRALPSGYKNKDLMLIPHQVANALRADGWYVRADFPWLKPNGMPGPWDDRPIIGHEAMFLLAPSPDYYFDQAGVRVPFADGRQGRDGATQSRANPNDQQRLAMPDGIDPSANGGRNRRTLDWSVESIDTLIEQLVAQRAALDAYLRHVTQVRQTGGLLVSPDGDPLALLINTVSYRGAHYATFPPKLVEPCLKATMPRESCATCGAPYTRVEEVGEVEEHPLRRNRSAAPAQFDNNADEYKPSDTLGKVRVRHTTGWMPSCTCGMGDLRADDYLLIATPTGDGGGDDPTQITGRSGFNRPRGVGEGTRPITRYEHRHYAAQLRASPEREAMRTEAGDEAFSHYERAVCADGRWDEGARAIPPQMLGSWAARGWLAPVALPERVAAPTRPPVALDPFAGTAVVGRVCEQLGWDFIGIEVSPAYLPLASARTATVQTALWLEGV